MDNTSGRSQPRTNGEILTCYAFHATVITFVGFFFFFFVDNCSTIECYGGVFDLIPQS